MEHTVLFKKTVALLISLIMLIGCVSCAGGKDAGGKDSLPFTAPPLTEKPQSTIVEDATPEAGVTDAPKEAELVFENALDSELAGLFISPSESESWGEPVSTIVKSGESETVPFSALKGFPGELYDVGTIDANGVNYDGYDIVLLDGDRIVLSGNSDSAEFIVRRQDGTTETIPADVYSDEPGEGKRSGYLYPYISCITDFSAEDETHRLYASLSCTSLGLNADEAERFPNLYLALSTLARKRGESAEKAYKTFSEDAYEAYLAEGIEFVPAEFSDEVFIKASEENILSMLFLRRKTIGEDVTLEYDCANYDPSSGALLLLSDVCEDVQSLAVRIFGALEENYSSFPFDEDTDLVPEFSKPSSKLFWTIDPKGLSIIIKGASFGGEEDYYSVFIPHSDDPDLINEQYLPKQENFASAFPLGADFRTVIGGKSTAIRISADTDLGQKLVISINGSDFNEDLSDIYEIKPYFVHSNGKDLLYLDSLSDNDYRVLLIYSLENGVVAPLEHFSGTWCATKATVSIGNYSRHFLPMVDPESFTLSVMTQLMGSVGASRVYRVGEEGLPVSEQKYFIIDRPDVEFTLKQPLELHYVTEDGDMDVSTVELAVGTKLTFFRTDGERFADLALENGRYVRAVIDDYCIGSTPIEELFDGIVYSG